MEETIAPRSTEAGEPSARLYALLLCIQTAGASVLFWWIFPVFFKLVSNIGQKQDLDVGFQIATLCGAAVMQICYWIRMRWVPVVVPFQNVFVGHLFLFASRVSFFFGGALFSAIFFRHVPALDALPAATRAIAKVAGVLGILFALFCYSLELERLGRAMEETRKPS